jgi:hypothetical protein
VALMAEFPPQPRTVVGLAWPGTPDDAGP